MAAERIALAVPDRLLRTCHLRSRPLAAVRLAGEGALAGAAIEVTPACQPGGISGPGGLNDLAAELAFKITRKRNLLPRGQAPL